MTARLNQCMHVPSLTFQHATWLLTCTQRSHFLRVTAYLELEQRASRVTTILCCRGGMGNIMEGTSGHGEASKDGQPGGGVHGVRHRIKALDLARLCHMEQEYRSAVPCTLVTSLSCRHLDHTAVSPCNADTCHTTPPNMSTDCPLDRECAE